MQEINKSKDNVNEEELINSIQNNEVNTMIDDEANGMFVSNCICPGGIGK